MQLEEVSKANRKHQRHPPAGIARPFTRKNGSVESGYGTEKCQLFSQGLRRDDIAAALGVLKASA